MADARADISTSGHTQTIRLTGDWVQGAVPHCSELEGAPITRLVIDGDDIGRWDTSLVAYARSALHRAKDRGLDVDMRLPEGACRLLSLADAVPRRERRQQPREDASDYLNPFEQVETLGRALRSQMEFVGSLLRAFIFALLGQSRMRRVDLVRFCAQAGSDAVPIISLTSLLVGMILGYLGAVQLQEFGAGIYVANLVSVGVLREMGPLMTAVIMAGRTGAAYAAQLGTMQVNEEVDAIEILGVSPTEFLILPRVLGIVMMTPLLVIYADVIGILGGGIVASGLGISPLQYVTQVEYSLTLSHLFVGLGKAIIFAALVGIAGCRAGIMADRNSEGVGRATTEAVVTSLVYLIVADAGINIFCQLADI